MTSEPFSLPPLIERLSPAVLTAVRQSGGAEPQRISSLQARPASQETQAIVGLIDQTLLKPEVTAAQVDALCDDARAFRFAAVSVNTSFVRQAARKLQGSGVCVCSVAGFPLGASQPIVKALEAQVAIDDGAGEIDMVMAIGRLIAGDYAAVAEDLLCLTRLAHARGALVKLVFETFLLNLEQKVAACLLAMHSGIDFVKTSTGFAGGGATVEDVSLMRSVVGNRVGVKAAGGIRSPDDARRMLAAGANRLGTSSGVTIARQIAEGRAHGGAGTGY